MQSLIWEALVMVLVLTGAYLLGRSVIKWNNRSIVVSLLITLLIGVGLGSSQWVRCLLLAVCPKDNRVKFEFKVAQPLDKQKINIAMVGSSQANCAIDEEVILQELVDQTNVGAVVDLHFPGSTPHSVRETTEHYHITKRFDIILYYLTNRDFYTERSYPVHNLTNREGVSQAAFQLFPDWAATSLRKRIFPVAFYAPEKKAWDQNRENKLTLLQESLNHARHDTSSQAVQSLIDFCEVSDTRIIFCLGFCHPSVDPEATSSQKMSSTLLSLTENSPLSTLYISDLTPSEKDFKDLTHTKVAFQQEYSKRLAAYIARQLDEARSQ